MFLMNDTKNILSYLYDKTQREKPMPTKKNTKAISQTFLMVPRKIA